MDSRCISTEELGVILDAPASDLRLAHVEACPRCRALMAAYRQFLAGDPGLSDPEMEQRLDQFLQKEIHGSDPSRSRGKVVDLQDADDPAGRHGWFTSGRVLVAAAAVLVLAVALDRFEPGPPQGPAVLRGDATEAVFQFEPAASLDPASGSVQLHWSAWPQADGYRVEIMDPGFQVLATFDSEADPSMVLGAEELGSLRQMASHLVWRVSVRVGSDYLASSAPQELPILQ